MEAFFSFPAKMLDKLINLFMKPNKQHRQWVKFGVLDDVRSPEEKANDQVCGVMEPPTWLPLTPGHWKQYSVRNQSTSSSCVAHASAKVFEAQTGLVQSAHPIYSVRTNAPAEGMYLADALNINTTKGTLLEASTASNGVDEQGMDAPVLLPNLVPYVGSAPITLDVTNIDQLASAIDAYKGIIITLNVCWPEWDTEQGVPSYIANSPIAGGHGVAGVAYGLWNGQKAIIAMNSWGNDSDSLSETSYIILTESFLQNRGTGAGAFNPPQQLMDTNQTLVKWANAIQEYEGYFTPGQTPDYPNGSLSYRNCNPGNVSYGSFAESFGGVANGRFAKFPVYIDGFNCLYTLLLNACTGKSQIYHPTMTLLQFYNLYAPPIENDTNSYAQFIAEKLGVTVDTVIGTFV